MRLDNGWFLLGVAVILWCGVAIRSNAGEPVTLENVVAPAANDREEPIAKKYSLQRAAHFLDSASLQWQKQRKCMTCHTNYAYLYARPEHFGRRSRSSRGS